MFLKLKKREDCDVLEEMSNLVETEGKINYVPSQIKNDWHLKNKNKILRKNYIRVEIIKNNQGKKIPKEFSLAIKKTNLYL